MMELCEVIYEFPYDTSPVVMEDSVNVEHEDGIWKYLVEKNDTRVSDKVRGVSTENENEYVIHRYITANKTEKYWIPKNMY